LTGWGIHTANRKYFHGLLRAGGIDLEVIALEAEMRHREAYPIRPTTAQYCNQAAIITGQEW